MQHIARKRFGQHFLTDHSTIAAIVDAIAPKPGQPMVEIGPGLAAITQPLVERLGHLTVIELDRDLAARLRQHPQLTVIESDVLQVNFANLLPTPPLESAQNAQSTQTTEHSEHTQSSACAPVRLRIVGNLPYNISTPILFHLLDFASHIEDQHFMLQKEVVDRMVAAPDNADYSRLSVMLQWRYAMQDILFVPPSSFNPPPRVNSAIVRMRPVATPPQVNPKLLSELVQVAFSQRRKLLRHTLGPGLETRQFSGQFDLQRRAQEVPVAQYLELALALTPTLQGT
jgi:16S rRNA (adenine1518-N6/adenine1519-N6)-dimethyltransferase